MSEPSEDETNIDFESILNRIAVANRRTRRRTLVGAITSDEIMQDLYTSWLPTSYLNILDLSSNIVIEPIDSSANIVIEPIDSSANDVNLPLDITSTLNRLLQSSFNDKPKYKNVLSSKGETELEDISYNIDLNTNSHCPIMHVDFIDGMDIIRLPCNHCFIPEAINRWLKEENALCPVCRYNLDSKEVKAEESSEIAQPQNVFEAIGRSHPSSLLSSILQPNPVVDNILPNTTNNFLQEIIQRVLLEQQEDELQQTIMNSLNNN
jgi:hypothetical protein